MYETSPWFSPLNDETERLGEYGVTTAEFIRRKMTELDIKAKPEEDEPEGEKTTDIIQAPYDKDLGENMVEIHAEDCEPDVQVPDSEDKGAKRKKNRDKPVRHARFRLYPHPEIKVEKEREEKEHEEKEHEEKEREEKEPGAELLYCETLPEDYVVRALPFARCAPPELESKQPPSDKQITRAKWEEESVKFFPSLL